ncbi:MAG: di-heme oxidoredictase family protein [Mesorhizobium sp.]
MRRALTIARRAAFLVLPPLLLAGTVAIAGATDARPVRDDLDAKTLKRVEAVTRPATDFTRPESFEQMPGGAATSKKLVNQDAFSNFSANMSFEDEGTFKLGNALFRKLWVSSPSSTQASDGLGPLFNARACQSCHLKDGRGHPPESSADATSMFLRLARQVEDSAPLAGRMGAALADPVYGTQLQDLAVPGLRSEGRMAVAYEEQPVTLGDGAVVSLRKPTYSVADLAYGPLDPKTTLSPRVSPQMIGLGLIEQIHPADILARADAQDRDGDGIAGRVSWTIDPKTGERVIGRFGHKASTATIRQQSADAFVGDIGISTPDAPRHWGDCTPAQKECLAMPNGVQERLGDTEAPDPVLDLVTFYSQNLAVPARRDADNPQVLAGKKTFYALGCATCHAPKYVTRKDAPYKPLAFQLIWPYTDLLLHDMGEGLADGQRVGDASGRDWRTAPLWGIGLTQTVNGHTFFLHDGRARSLTEAILWHGGEAQKSRDGFAALPKAERDALVKFVESL